jgi:hypothetical protein
LIKFGVVGLPIRFCNEIVVIVFKNFLDFVVGIYYEVVAYVAFLALLIEFGVDELLIGFCNKTMVASPTITFGKFLDFVVFFHVVNMTWNWCNWRLVIHPCIISIMNLNVV